MNEVVKHDDISEDKLREWLEAFGLAKDALPEEQQRFIGIARELQLNPFKREIYLVVYGQGDNRTCSVITGYEVYLKRADRLSKVDGWTVTIEGEGERMVAKGKLYRKDWSHPFEWEVYYKEAFQKKRDGSPTRPWAQQPKFMLKKVCAAQMFRLAFPDEMGGMPYIAEEVTEYEEERDVTHSAETPTTTAAPPAEKPKQVSELVNPTRRKLLDRLHDLVNEGKLDISGAKEWEKEINTASTEPAADAMAHLAGIGERIERFAQNVAEAQEELDAIADMAFTDDEPDEQQEGLF